jgi:hypothetical protein
MMSTILSSTLVCCATLRMFSRPSRATVITCVIGVIDNIGVRLGNMYFMYCTIERETYNRGINERLFTEGELIRRIIWRGGLIGAQGGGYTGV